MARRVHDRQWDVAVRRPRDQRLDQGFRRNRRHLGRDRLDPGAVLGGLRLRRAEGAQVFAVGPNHESGRAAAFAHSLQRHTNLVARRHRDVVLGHDGAGVQNLVARNVLGERPHVVVGRVGDHLFGRADLHELAVLHDRDVVAHLDRLQEVVGDEDHGLVHDALEPEQLVLHLAPDQGVEGAERLVEQHDIRVDRECARQADALLHAARELARVVALPAGQSDQLEHFLRLFAPLDPGHALDLQPVGDVVDDPAMGQQAEVLEHHGHLVPPEVDQLALAHRGHVGAVDHDLPRGRLHQPRDAAHQRRLAAAREAHDHEGLALPHLEGHVLDRDDVAGALLHLLARQRGIEFAQDALGVAPEHLPQVAAANLGLAGVFGSRLGHLGPSETRPRRDVHLSHGPAAQDGT